MRYENLKPLLSNLRPPLETANFEVFIVFHNTFQEIPILDNLLCCLKHLFYFQVGDKISYFLLRFFLDNFSKSLKTASSTTDVFLLISFS